MRRKDEDERWPCCEAVMTQLVLGEWICDRLTVGAEIMNGLTSEFAKLQLQHLSTVLALLWKIMTVVDGDVSWLHALNRQFTSTGSKILDQLDKLNCSVFSTTTTSLKRVEQCTMCTRCITRSAQNGPRMQPSQVPHLQVYKVHHYTGQVISN